MAAGLQGILDKAIAAHRRGALDVAERGYLTVLKAVPRHLNALQLLGGVAVQRRQYERADQLLATALEIDPRHLGALINRSIALQGLDRLTEALAAVDQALAINPGVAAAVNNRGSILRRLGRATEALASFDRAIAMQPGYADAMCNRGDLLFMLSRPDEAWKEYNAVLAIQRNSAPALQGCGDVLAHFGRRDEAIKAYQAALKCGGNEANINHFLAALGVGEPARASPAKFVRDIFDGYAERFDDELVNKLEYRMPVLVADAVKRRRPGVRLDVADLGCGTGLCGPLLRPSAKTLIGVDLSPNMLEKARQRQVYDVLHCTDIVQYLRGQPAATFDVVIATDVFIYVGRLEEVFLETARVLREGGIFAFSVEVIEGDGFELRKSRRFGHSARYIQQLADAGGFRIEARERHMLRLDWADKIDGDLYMLTR